MGQFSGPQRAAEQTAAPLARAMPPREGNAAATGNQFRLRRLQAKLTIGAVDDPLEHEADAVAEQVMRMPDPTVVGLASPPRISRKCAACEEEDKLQTKRSDPDGAGETAPAAVDATLRSSGQPLDAGARDFFEPRFGADFSAVRIHTDAAAAQSAASVAALGYTVGSHIVFAADRFDRSTATRNSLLAHELTHVVQQGAAGPRAVLRRVPDLAACVAQKDDILPPNVGLVEAIAREQELADKLGADYEPLKKMIMERPDTRALVCQHGVPGVLALATTRTAQGVLDVPAATAKLTGAPAPAVPVPTPVPVVTPAAGPDDFKIDRVGKSTTAKVFFARGSATIDAAAQAQIDAFKKTSPSGVRLVGYASADEPAALAQSRADAVKTALTAAPDAVTVSDAAGNAAATASRSDFTGARSVELLVGGAPPTTVDCGKKDAAGHPVNPPKQPCTTMDPPTWTSFQAAHTIAKDAMSQAVTAVSGTPSADNTALIDKFFGGHDAATLATLQTNLGRLNTHVINLPAETDCGGECDDGGCEVGAIAYNNGHVDAASRMTLCVPTFKTLASDNDRARNLVHETAHGTSPLGGGPAKGTKDLAYRHERMLFELPPADRLRNSDSYALFALFVREAKVSGDPKKAPAGIATPENDNLPYSDQDPEKPALKLALAKLEKRLTWSKDWVGQMYGQIVKIRAGSFPWAGSWAEPLMTEAAKHFPLTSPPAQPTLDDQVRVAAMNDRYIRMSATVKNNLTITRMNTGLVSWNPPAAGTSPFLAGTTIGIGPDFFRATPEDQISLLLEQLAKATKGVEPAFIPAYVSLAKWIHDKNP